MSDFVQAEQQIIVNVMHGLDTSLAPEDMQSPKHEVILRAAEELRDRGVVPDLITLNHRLAEKNRLEDAGGIGYLSDLYTRGLPAKNIEPYEQIVKEQKFIKGVRMHALNLQYMLDEGSSVEDVMAEVQSGPMRLGSPTKSGQTVIMQDFLYDEYEKIKARQRAGHDTSGVPSPWTSLNRYTNGFQKEDLIIVAGRPSMGKSAMALQQGLHTAQTTGPVFITSMEMSRSNLVDRSIAVVGKVDGEGIRSGYLSNKQYGRIEGAIESLLNYHPILINDTPRLTAQDIRILGIQAKSRYPSLAMIIVDYLGLIRSSEPKQRYLEVGEATRVMKQMARETGVPVMLVCQLNRSCEMREDKRPLLSDLRESGDIEQDADLVIMVYRKKYYDDQEDNTAEFIIRKQRNGPVGTANVVWLPNITSFENYLSGVGDDDGRDGSMV